METTATCQCGNQKWFILETRVKCSMCGEEIKYTENVSQQINDIIAQRISDSDKEKIIGKKRCENCYFFQKEKREYHFDLCNALPEVKKIMFRTNNHACIYFIDKDSIDE